MSFHETDRYSVSCEVKRNGKQSRINMQCRFGLSIFFWYFPIAIDSYSDCKCLNILAFIYSLSDYLNPLHNATPYRKYYAIR